MKHLQKFWSSYQTIYSS